MHAKHQRVQIINVDEAKSEEYKAKLINFLMKNLEGITVKISNDMQKVIFTSR